MNTQKNLKKRRNKIPRINKRRDWLKMSYFDNFDNGYLNKYKINFKNEKKIIDVFFYL
jgi:hypothetical protein